MKKVIFLILFFLVLSALIALIYYEKYISNYQEAIKALRTADTSTQPNTKCNKDNYIWLTSYAHGEAHIANQRVLNASSLNHCVDATISYQKKDIDQVYFEKHKKILDQKRGAGYWMWKPYFILKALDIIPENDLLLYSDSGSMIISSMDHLVEKLGDSDILMYKNHYGIRPHIKRDLLKMMDMDNEHVRNSKQVQGAWILIRNTKKSRDFITKWKIISENEHAITDTPSKDEYKDFVDHRHDQAILSLLYLQNSENIKLLPNRDFQKSFVLHRRRNVKDRSLIFPRRFLRMDELTINKALVNR